MDLSNILKSMNFGNKSNAMLDSLQTLPKANTDVNNTNNFADGQVVKGEVVDLNGLVANIVTESGAKLKGHLQNVGQLNIGDERSFLVKNENGQIKFGIVSEEIPSQLDKVLKNELMNLGIPGGEKELETAKSFIKNDLPVNKETFNNLAKALSLITKDDGAFEKALFLLKNEMPLNKNSAKMLDDFISKEINTLANANEIEEGINNLKDTNLKNAIISIINGEDDVFMESKEKVILIDKEINQLDKMVNNADDTTENIGDKVKTAVQNPNGEAEKLADNKANITNLASGEAEDVLPEKALKQAMADTNLLDGDENIKELVNQLDKVSTDDKKLLKDVMKFDLKTENKADVDKFLNETNNRLDKAIKLLEKNDSPEAKKLMENMITQRESVDFMNFTKNNLYLQMPLSINQNQTNGELLVFKDKKKAKNSNGSVSAIIGLDTATLGRYETYIAKTGNSIELQFRLESKEIVELTKNNFGKLTELLHDHNLFISNVKYKTIEDPFTMVTKEEQILDLPENNTLPNYNFNVKL